MKKKVISFLLALCLIAALLPVGVFAAGSGTLSDPWIEGSVKMAIVDGYELHIFGSGDYTEPAKNSALWAANADKITSVVIDSGIASLKNNSDGTKLFASLPNASSMTVRRTFDGSMPAELNISGATIPANIKVHMAFDGTGAIPADFGKNLRSNLYSVTIDEGVSGIGNDAFYGSEHLSSVTIPSTVTSIGKDAFTNTAITVVSLKHDFTQPLSIHEKAFPSDIKLNIEVTKSDSGWNYGDKSAQPWAAYRANIVNVTIDPAAAKIADYAFASCNNIKSIELLFSVSDNVKNVGNNWMLGIDEKATIVSVKASDPTSALVFQEWEGSGDLTVINKYAASTYLEYKGDAFSITAKWTSEKASIKIEPKEDKNFGEIEFGYADVELYNVKVTNNGNNTITLIIETTGGNSSAFVLSKTSMTLAKGESDTFTVCPKPGQAIGTYHSTVALKDGNNVQQGSFAVRYGVSTSYTRAEDFVRRLYKNVLDRTDEQINEDPGLKDWATKISGGQITAAEVAAGFFGSQEFRNKNLNDEEFVKRLYRAMMNREYDAAGLKTWTDQLAAGKTRAWVFTQFVNSAEFKNLCAYYGLTIGSVDYTKYDMGKNNSEKVANDKIIAFVKRLYKHVLNRTDAQIDADTAGVNDWSKQLANKKSTGAVVAAGFFGSVEYVNRNRTDEEFLSDLYRAMFDRSVDETGKKTWGDALAAGKGRVYVFQQVCGSVEFHNLCASYGVTPGNIDGKKYNMGKSTSVIANDAEAKAFIKSLYKYVLGRSDAQIAADAAGIQNWADKIVKNNYTAAQVAISLYTSAEYTNRKLSNEDFVKSLYHALLGRDDAAITTAEVSNYATKLAENKTTRIAVFGEFVGSTEFKNYCAKNKLTPGTVDTKKYTIDPGMNVATITNDDAVKFVKILYKNVLGRSDAAIDADTAGVQQWADKIVKNGYTGAQVINALYGSVECANRNMTNEEYVKSLYLAILDRTGTEAEVNPYVAQLDANSATRDQLRSAFINSAEYKARCAKIKLTAGSK